MATIKCDGDILRDMLDRSTLSAILFDLRRIADEQIAHWKDELEKPEAGKPVRDTWAEWLTAREALYKAFITIGEI